MSAITFDPSDLRRGDLLTWEINGRLETGTAVPLRRRSDGSPFVMADMRDGSRKGERIFLDGTWARGAGPHLFWCAECAQRTRSEDPHEVLCAVCDRPTRKNAPDDDHTNLRWRSQDRAQGRKR